jgi:NADH-quinone oxidoreductase subunit G
MAADVPALGTMTYADIPDTGLLLDATRWSGLPFAEGPSLHFRPASPAPKEAGP